MPPPLPLPTASPSAGRPLRVTVVAVPLGIGAGERGELEAILSAAERDRAARLVEPVRRRFVAGRGRLRRVLGAWLGADPGRLVFEAGPEGKPFLAGPHAGRCHFNLTHCGDAALLALSPDAAVGIDLELTAPAHTPAWAERMAGSILAPAERAAFLEHPAGLRPAALLAAWVVKEAVVKGTGAGIGTGVGHLVIAVPPPHASLVTGTLPQRVDLAPVAPPWHVCLLDGAVGALAALACPGSVCQLQVETYGTEDEWPGRSPTADR